MHYSMVTKAYIFKMIDARDSEIQRKGIQAYAESMQTALASFTPTCRQITN